MGTLQKKAATARTWKRDAWAYYKAAKPALSKSAIANNFVNVKKPTVSAYQVEIYFSQREKLTTERKPP